MTTHTEKFDEIDPFVLWMTDQLQLPIERIDGAIRVAIPNERRAAFDGREALTLSLDGAAETSIQCLVDALNGAGPVHSRPRDQPQSVHEITGRLFDAYTLEDGNVHLAGCRLEDRLFMRATFRRVHGDGETAELEHIFVDDTGNQVDPDLAKSLGMTNLEPYGEWPPKADDRVVETVRQAACEIAGESALLLVAALVWCKFATGKLSFDIRGASAELPFCGWAATLQAPPFPAHAAHSDTRTQGSDSAAQGYQLAATDDGRIARAAEIGKCAESSRTVLLDELITCEATGDQILPQYAANCPVTGDRVRHTSMVHCSACNELVSPTAIEGGVCRACRQPEIVDKDDPRMARILGEHPGLDRWRRWRLSETASAYIAIAMTLLSVQLVALDKETLEPMHLATRSRLSSRWSPLAPSQYDEILR